MGNSVKHLERDFIGERELPEAALFGIQSLRGSENSAVSGWKLANEPHLVSTLAEIKLASARANHELNVIDPKQSQAIVRACQEIIAGKHHENFIIDMMEGSGATSINMNMNEVVANLGRRLTNASALHPNDHVNMSQSTNDVVPSAIKIAAYRMTGELLVALRTLGNALDSRARAFEDVLHLGRTCLQDAQPMTLGQVFSGYAAAVSRQVSNIKRGAEELLSLPLGGTAIGTGLGAPTDYSPVVFKHLRDLTGLDVRPSNNLFDGMQNADAFARFSGELKSAALVLGKVANDLIILSSGPNGGFGEIRLPAVQAGSSIMPGKVNPVIPQLMSQISYAVAGNDVCISMATQQGQLEINAYEPVTATRLFDSLRLLTNGCHLFASKCIGGVEADEERNKANLISSNSISTAFVKVLGYAKVADLVRQSQAEKRSFRELVIEQGLVSEERYLKVVRTCAMGEGQL